MAIIVDVKIHIINTLINPLKSCLEFVVLLLTTIISYIFNKISHRLLKKKS